MAIIDPSPIVTIPEEKPLTDDNSISEFKAKVDNLGTSLKWITIGVPADIIVDWLGIDPEDPVPNITSCPSSVKTEATDSALVEILYEVENYVRDGITNEELRSTKSSMLNADALKYESPMQKLSFLNRILTYDLDNNFIKKQSKVLNTISKEEVDNLAKSNIKKDNLQIVIVCNSYLIKKKLENLTSKNGKRYNYKIVETK